MDVINFDQSRRSDRVSAKQKLLEESLRLALIKDIDSIKKVYEIFHDSLDEYELPSSDKAIHFFDIPSVWKPKVKVSNKRLNDDTSHRDSESKQVKRAISLLPTIPSFRKLKQNFYRPPLSRPHFDIDNSPICVCKVNCDSTCQNRLLFMYFHYTQY